MKLTVQMVVINEEDYVYFALKSIYDVVEEIVIVEGAARNRYGREAIEQGFLTEEGLSTDGTQAEIQRMLDEDADHKIKYIRYGWQQSVNDLRRHCHQNVSSNTDYCLILDSDAVYRPREIQCLRNLVIGYPSIWMIAAKELMFFLDLNHILTVGEDYLQMCNYIDSGLFWKYLPDIEILGQRPYRLGQKMELGLRRTRFQELKTLDKKGEKLYLFEPAGLFDILHFGWVHTPEKMERHILRWAHATRNLVARGGGDERMKRWCAPILESNDGEIMEYYQTYHKIWTGIYDESVEEHLEKFTGTYPVVMLEHPYYGKSAEELGW